MRALGPALLAAGLVFTTATAIAKDRPVTDEERPKFEAALKEAGCAGGKMEFDDDKSSIFPAGKFEIDDPVCRDGKRYDLSFDPGFKLVTRKLD